MTEEEAEMADNTQVTMTMRTSQIMTVPIDTTLSRSGEAADAKAVGDALALKADKDDIHVDIDVNGQSADAQGHIELYPNHIPMSASDPTTLADKIADIKDTNATEIKMNASTSALTIAQAMTQLEGKIDGKRGENIAMSESDPTTIKDAIEAIEEIGERTGDEIPLDDSVTAPSIKDAIAEVNSKTGEDIAYDSDEYSGSIKDAIDAVDDKADGIQAIFDDLFPVGAVITTQSTEPPALFGTWQEVVMETSVADAVAGIETFVPVVEPDPEEQTEGSGEGSGTTVTTETVTTHYWQRIADPVEP